jgi:hypothetical protein
MGRCLAYLLLTAAVVSGCASEPFLVAPARVPAHYERLGSTSGEACGALIVYALPIMMNSRVERAYADALLKAPGATALLNVELTESWYIWPVLGHSHCVILEGTAIRETAAP